MLIIDFVVLQLHSMMCYRVTPEKTFEARQIFPSFPKQSPKPYAELATLGMSDEPASRPTMEDVAVKIKAMLYAVVKGEQLEPL